MSYSVSGNRIVMTRGDTIKIQVELKYKTTGEAYTPQTGDSIRFAVKKYFSDPTLLIEKEVPIDTQLLTIDPEDTKSLTFGTYCFDMQLTFANGDVDTFIPNGVLQITNEVS